MHQDTGSSPLQWRQKTEDDELLLPHPLTVNPLETLLGQTKKSFWVTNFRKQNYVHVFINRINENGIRLSV